MHQKVFQGVKHYIKKSFSKKYRFYWIIGIAILVIAGFIFLRNGEETETLVVHPGEFLQQVAVSGTIVPVQEVSIAVAQGGPVSSVYVKVGDIVEKGAQLLVINTASLRADLLSAQADVSLKKAEIQNKEVNIDQITKEQNTLVESAYRTLLSDDLVAVPDSTYNDLTAPTITGRYTGSEGVYDIRVYNENRHVKDYFLSTFGAETTDPVQVLEFEPTSLGSHGLFISFPDGVVGYINTIWRVSIPNVKGASYVENYNSYINAVDTKARTIADAKENLEEASGTSILRAQLAKAEAMVQSILADISDRIIRAPFSGLITNIEVKVGETASTNQVAVEMMSSGSFQVESYVPEIYVPLVKIGDGAQVVLDAYGQERPFNANVVAINPAKTLKDGLPTYKTTLQIEDDNEEIRSGMTANIIITTERKENVISVPQGTVKNREGKKFVMVQEGKETIEREVKTGIVSSLGNIEITSGLQDGDIVVIK